MGSTPPVMDLQRDGAVYLPGAAAAWLSMLEAILADLPQDRAGVRLHGIAALRELLSPGGGIGAVVARVADATMWPVRALLLDKRPDANWGLGWHQDRTIVVTDRIEVDGYGPWTVKQGLLHVAPPADLLARMLTIRIHIDPVDAGNAPLLIAPGTHRLGRVPEGQIEALVERHGMRPCPAEAGDVWCYATPILHASDAAVTPRRRRVLQVDYSADALPGGLRWLGI